MEPICMLNISLASEPKKGTLSFISVCRSNETLMEILHLAKYMSRYQNFAKTRELHARIMLCKIHSKCNL